MARRLLVLFALSPVFVFPNSPVLAQESVVDTDTLPEEYRQFVEQMEGAVLVGCFTADPPRKDDGTGEGSDKSREEGALPYDLHEERYEIRRVKKLDKEDFWIIQARIKYGQRDMTVPVPVRVKWAGRTPVITMDQVAIPGMGTFDARVIIHDGKYAGTWRHDRVSGHLFGRVEKRDAGDSVQPPADSPAPVKAIDP